MTPCLCHTDYRIAQYVNGMLSIIWFAMQINTQSGYLILQGHDMKLFTKPHKLVSAIQKTAIRRLLSIPKPIMSKITGKPIVIDGQTFNVPLRLLLKLLALSPKKTRLKSLRAEIDEQAAWLAQPSHPDIIIDDFAMTIDNDVIRLRRYRHPKTTGIQPALIYYHGGGYVVGSITSHDTPCQHLAADGQCTVISVDYRLAPEYPFPTPINDGIAAFRHIATHADKFEVDIERLAVGGDSAGANLATVVAQQTKHDQISPMLQLLWVPWVDMSRERPSYDLFGEGFFLDRAQARWYLDHYLSDETDKVNPLASPIFAELKDVAPAVIFVAGFDVLRDEGIEYAHKLKKAGVDTELIIYESLPHPFFNMAGEINDATTAFANATTILRERMDTTTK